MKEVFIVFVTKFVDVQEIKGKTFSSGFQWTPLSGEEKDSYPEAQKQIDEAAIKFADEKNYYRIDKYFKADSTVKS